MDESVVIGMFEELSDLIDSSKPTLGNSQKRTIEIGPILDLIEEIRDAFPPELSEARRIMRSCQELIDSANEKANNIIADAEKQAATIASEQEVVRLADQERDRILTEAADQERDMRYGSYEYADGVFAQLEVNLDNLLQNVSKCRARLNDQTQPM
jgi:cell division septum initiation protein DivIVA